MFPNRSHVVAAALAASLALSACGGVDTVSVGAYARAVCGSVRTWQEHIRTRTDRMKRSLGSDVSPAKGKAALATYLDGLVQETDRVIDRLNATGVPDVTNGQDVASKMVGAFLRVRSSLRTARAGVERLPTGDRAAFRAATSKIGNDIQTSFAAVGSSLSGVLGPELDRALAAEKSCGG